MALKKRLLPRCEEITDKYVGKQFKTSGFSEEVFTIESFNKDLDSYNISYVDKSSSIVILKYSAGILRKSIKRNNWILTN
jgi:hypothetical protein